MNKRIKTLTCSIAMALVLQANSVINVKAYDGQVQRFGGKNRYETACKLAVCNWKQTDNIVLVSGEGYADALSASVIAKKLNAPIILTTSNNLDNNARNAIEKLKAKNVYIIGGEGVISVKIRNELKVKYNLVELGGKDRFETNLKVAEKLVELGVDPSDIIVANGAEGFSDSLSVAPIAAANEKILLLVSKDNGNVAAKFIQKHNSKARVIGTKNVISEEVYNKLGASGRINGGANRFETNLNILKAFKCENSKHLYIAHSSSDDYADALVASALAGKYNSPLMLISSENSKDTENALNYIKDNFTIETKINAVGGEGVISNFLIKTIDKNVNKKPQSKPVPVPKPEPQPQPKPIPPVPAPNPQPVPNPEPPVPAPKPQPIPKPEPQPEQKLEVKVNDNEIIQKSKDNLKLNNVDLNNVINDLVLPNQTKEGVIITWQSTNSKVIDNKGKVVRPEAIQGDAAVTLTATLTKGKAKETKDFIVTVKAKEFTDEQIVDRALNNLQIKGNLNCVVDNVKLLTKDNENNVNIAWNSSNPSVVSNTGIVTRTDKDEKIILTATLTKGSVNKTKKFNINVKAKEKNTEESLKLIASSLEINNKDNIENDIKLPTSLDGSTIAWKSNNEPILSSIGKVKRPEIGQPNVKVTLTATISKDGKNITKDFILTVKAKKELVANTKDEFYDMLKNALDNCEETVKIKVPNYNSTDYSLDIINQICIEHPEVDYGKPASQAQIYSYGGKERVLEINLNYKKDVSIIKQEKEKSKQEVQRIIKEVIKDEMNNFQKELALHDYIVKTADYDTENYKNNTTTLEDHTAYGVLIDHKGVCESYAKAMYELLNAVGIECKYVTGYSKHNGVKGGGHAWNMVKLENEWYNLDATWDDPVSDRNGAESLNKDASTAETVRHTYFNIQDSVFNQDHIRGEFEQAHPELYPSCTATKYSYNNMDVDEYTADGKLIEKVTSKEQLDAKILNALKNKEKTLNLRIRGFKMSQQELSDEVKKVSSNNYVGGFRWSTMSSDEYHVYYEFTW